MSRLRTVRAGTSVAGILLLAALVVWIFVREEPIDLEIAPAV